MAGSRTLARSRGGATLARAVLERAERGEAYASLLALSPGDQEARERLEEILARLEQRRADFIALCVHEAGKTLSAAISEVREAAAGALQIYDDVPNVAERLIAYAKKAKSPCTLTTCSRRARHGRRNCCKR